MKKKLLVLMLACSMVISSCGQSGSDDGEKKTQATTNEAADAGASGEETTQAPEEDENKWPLTAQGNPLAPDLNEILEEDENGTYTAWIKISTQYDPELSMYLYDNIPEGTTKIVVDFSITGFDIPAGSTTAYWCYQLTAGGEGYSVWDESSPTEKLEITGDGDYTITFDAGQYLAGPIEEIQSLQIVFPGFNETTSTVIAVKEASAVIE